MWPRKQKKSEDVHIDQNLIDKYNSDISKLDSEIENESKKFYEFSSQKEKEIVKIDNNNTQIKLREKVINDNKEVMNVLCEDCKHKVDGIYGISKYESLSEPLRLEYILALIFGKKFGSEGLCSNLIYNENGLPISYAPGGKGDLIYKDFLTEATMIKNKN